MQMKQAIQLRKTWEAKGNPPCKHAHFDKEYIQEWDTGDKVCTTCGKTFSPDEFAEISEAREKQSNSK